MEVPRVDAFKNKSLKRPSTDKNTKKERRKGDTVGYFYQSSTPCSSPPNSHFSVGSMTHRFQFFSFKVSFRQRARWECCGCPESSFSVCLSTGKTSRIALLQLQIWKDRIMKSMGSQPNLQAAFWWKRENSALLLISSVIQLDSLDKQQVFPLLLFPLQTHSSPEGLSL